MANVEDLLRKQKDRIEKISASPTPRKKITRTGPTRPWQENLPQYQGAESTVLPPVNVKSQKNQKPKSTDFQSTEIHATQAAEVYPPSASSVHVENTEIQSTEIESTRPKSTKVESTHFRSTGLQSTENKSTQIQSTESRSTEEVGVGEALEPVVRTSGYFQLNYSALELMRRLEAGEFVVFQFLTLKAWGWNVDKHRIGSGLVRAAGTYVSQSLGIAKSSADKYLGRLVERGLLTLVEKSHKRGNTYRVAPFLAVSNEKVESRLTELRSTSLPKFGQLVDQNSVSSSPNLGQLVDRDSVTLIDSKKVDNRSLSQSAPPAWTEFTAQLTEKARERAERVFQSLRNQFPNDPVDEIAECPCNLERFGAPDGTPWEKINSPIGLMESSWPQLREFFRKRATESQKANHARERIEAERIKAEEQDRREAEESQRRRKAFLAAFPDEQGRREIIQKYLAGFPFNADGMIGQGIAIGKWWEEQQSEKLAHQVEQSLGEVDK